MLDQAKGAVSELVLWLVAALVGVLVLAGLIVLVVLLSVRRRDEPPTDPHDPPGPGA